MDDHQFAKLRQINIKKQIARSAFGSLGGDVNANNVGRLAQICEEILFAFNEQQKPFKGSDQIIKSIKRQTNRA